MRLEPHHTVEELVPLARIEPSGRVARHLLAVRSVLLGLTAEAVEPAVAVVRSLMGHFSGPCHNLSTAAGPAAGLMVHSDRGNQYASGHYRSELSRLGMVCSMSGAGQRRDNAVVESTFDQIKRELVHHERHATRDEARASIPNTSSCSTTASAGTRPWGTTPRPSTSGRITRTTALNLYNPWGRSGSDLHDEDAPRSIAERFAAAAAISTLADAPPDDALKVNYPLRARASLSG